MNGGSRASEPALAMICLSTKQEPPQESPNSSLGSQIPASSAPLAIDAQPLQSVSPRPQENGNVEGDEIKKPEREHKKRSKNWTRIETTKLIRIRSDMEPRFCRAGRKSDLWDEISDLLKSEGVCRDPQQCRDKWEKLTAAYKEVRDGLRDKEDYPFYSDLDPILSGKPHRRDPLPPPRPPAGSDGEETEEEADLRKRPRRRSPELDRTMEAVKEVLESVVERQQRFLADLMERMERRERIREKIRQEREDKWREEDRAHRAVFENAILLLAKKMGREREEQEEEEEAEKEKEEKEKKKKKKRSRNWKRAEVLLLIKLRREMEGRFEKAARKGAVWDELAGLMCAEGVKRDGKQCREKWDKLMAEFKDVTDGRRNRGESPYFADLLGRGSASLGNPTAED